MSKEIVEERRWRDLYIGQFVYVGVLRDMWGPEYYKHEIISIDIQNKTIEALDHSQDGIKVIISDFETAEEAGIKEKSESFLR